MHLNDIKPAEGAKTDRSRVGRGIGSGMGKTCRRGHKGQKSRSGGTVRVGFEGGQMPLKQRVPKFGFTSRIAMVTAQVRLSELAKLPESVTEVDLVALKLAGIVPQNTQRAKVFLSGSISRSLTLKGLSLSKGAKAAIEAAGGKIEE